jgi:hypothetical protein
MRREDRVLRQVLAGLSTSERLDAWMDAMRRAGGLGFMLADEEIKHELFEIEQSTPEQSRGWFRENRDKIIGVNGVMNWLLGGFWLQAEALLSRITTLICLSVIAKAEDTKEALLAVLNVGEDTTGTRSSKQGLRASDEAPVDDLAAFLSVMFAYDESSLSHYWKEILKGSPLRHSRMFSVDVRALIEQDGEPITRALASYVRELATSLNIAAAYIEAFQGKNTGDVGDLGQCILAPVEECLERNKEILQTLKERRLGEHMPEIELGNEEIEIFRNVVNYPRRYNMSNNVIQAYEKWLYPENMRAYSNEEVEWRVWHDYHR